MKPRTESHKSPEERAHGITCLSRKHNMHTDLLIPIADVLRTTDCNTQSEVIVDCHSPALPGTRGAQCILDIPSASKRAFSEDPKQQRLTPCTDRFAGFHRTETAQAGAAQLPLSVSQSLAQGQPGRHL